MSAVIVKARNEPSDAAWRRSGDIAARILENLAQRDARSAAAKLAPRAEAWDEIAGAGTDYAVRDVAPMLSRAGIETGPQRLFETLHELGWIYRGEKRRWAPYARAVDAGFLKVRAMAPYRDRDTGDLVPAAPQVRVTAKGVERLRVRLGAGALTP
ncbi:phage antirepressor KilAC domain-containing protein [Microbacterium sp. B19(2022)]|uniref:phage antirepressor KilAC domain-containing protein n=1 Tax=Microbacterium sp. B19(2022) TaxID=2914045 RepID=UPI00197BD1E6